MEVSCESDIGNVINMRSILGGVAKVILVSMPLVERECP